MNLKTVMSKSINSLSNYLSALFLLFFGTLVNAGTVAQSPLFLTTSAEPNIMLMIDNSGSMTNIVPEAPYDSSTTYSCSSSNVISESQDVQIRISSGPKIYYSSTNYSWGSDRCFNPTGTYYAKLYADNGTYPSGYLGTNYSGNYLNWYFNSGNTSPSWTNQEKKPGTRSRLEIAKPSAKTLIDSLDSVRIGLSTYNNSDGGTLHEVIGNLSSTKKTNVKTKIDAITSAGMTPLAETLSDIGRYFTTGYSGNLTLHPENSPTSSSISSIFNSHSLNNQSGVSSLTSPIQYSCQKSFAVMMTDGRSQGDQSISSVFADYDGDCALAGANCGSYDRKPSPVTYESVGSDYLDDVAQALFEMDLRPDLEDSYGGKNNLITYTVGFADANVENDPLLQEAATQGGGQFYFAEDAATLSSSLSSVFQGIAEQSKSSASSVATNSTQYQSDSLIYQATFNSDKWEGHFFALELTTEDTNGNGTLDTGEDTNGNGKIDAGSLGSPQWDAADQLPAESSRKIYSYNPSATGTKGIEFLWSNLNATQQSVMGSSFIVDYLRGNQSQEIDSGGSYRNRSSLLGDFINSDPLFVARENLGYSKFIGAEGSSYTAFATVSPSPRKMLYLGANDGMLHGFDSTNGIDGGKEIFAYLPNTVISTELVSLSNPNYTHKYFVDGSAQAGDVYFDSAWHTVLVGSTGAGNTTEVASGSDLPTGVGGRGVFALDVTDPDSFDETKVLWEFSSRDDPDLGHTISIASVARMANGQWAAIVSNGYNSTSGKSVLYILNIKDGSVIKKIEAEALTGTNGLSSPIAVDSDSDQIVDYIYAGDLNGNLWKFDVSSSSVTDWGVAYSGNPLFVANDSSSVTQPITSITAVSKASGKGQPNGLMIYFGTGKYFETGDEVVPVSPQIQTFYGIWDVCDASSPSTCNGTISGRSLLQEQSILFEDTSATSLN